jgi:eukaryotic-like serine/threonine-protein kinase
MVPIKKICERTIIILVLFLLIIFAIYGSSSQTLIHGESGADNWAMYHHEPAHTGYSDTTVPTAAIHMWNYTIDTEQSSIPASPAVVDGFVYVGSGDSNIYCFDAVTGSKVWNFPTGGYADSTPAVVDGHVYAGSADGYVYCLDASNGAKIWSYPIVDQEQRVISVDSSPTVVGDRVYIESRDGNIYCLDTTNGNKVWNYSTGVDVSSSSPTVDGGYVYVGNNAGDVFCLTASNGAKVWKFTAGGAVHSPAVANGCVYFGSADGNAYCLNASDGAKRWNYTTEFNSNGPSHNYHWGNTVSDPAIAYGKVYVGSSDFLVYCLDASNGAHIWNYTTNAEVYASPAVADGCVLAGSYDGNVYCLNASSGSEIWSFTAGIFSSVNAGGSAGSPAVADGTVYVVGNGIIYALGSPATNMLNSWPMTVVVAVVVALVIVVGTLAFVYRKVKKKEN